MKNKIFLCAFILLTTYQVARFYLSLSVIGKYKLDENHNFVRDQLQVQDKPNTSFFTSFYSGLSSEEERIQRKEAVETYCSKVEKVKSVDELTPQQKSILYKHVIVSDKYKFLYCYTPKVACSNWKRVIKMLNGELDTTDLLSKMDHKHGLHYLHEFSEREIEYRLKNYYKFTFVRNPPERLLSGYRNKFEETIPYLQRYGPKIINTFRNATRRELSESYRGKLAGDDVTFEEYLRYLLSQQVESMDEHWAPMVSLCRPCIVNYDFIGSYDHIYEDSEAVLRKIGAPNNVHFPSRQAWYSPTTFATTAYYYSLVNPVHMRHLFIKYSKDFEAFSFPVPEIP